MPTRINLPITPMLKEWTYITTPLDIIWAIRQLSTVGAKKNF